MSDVDNLCYSYEQSIKAAMRFAWALAVAAAFVAFAVGFLMGRAGASVSPEVPRTIRLQLEVLGAGASAPTAITTTNETEKETTGND